MCKRNCYYRSGALDRKAYGVGQICSYSSITGRTRTGELIEAYRKQGRKLTDKEKTRILTDSEHCQWYQPPGTQKRDPVQITLFNSRGTIVERRCVACGKAFAGGRRAFYCPDCRAVRKKEMQEAWRDRQFGITCRDCGKTFIGHYQAKYCPECRTMRRAEGGRKSASIRAGAAEGEKA